MMEIWISETWQMINASAPWLLIGFLFAGILRVLVPVGIVKRHLQAPGFKSVLKSSIFGIPLPLCSCSVIPVGVSLRKHGASRGSTASFFISTPEIGVDSFLLSYVLLGPPLAVIRVVAVFFSAIGVGAAIDRWAGESDAGDVDSVVSDGRCCSGSETEESENGCAERGDIGAAAKKVIHFAYVEIFNDLAGVLTLGFIGAGLVAAVFPANLFSELNLHPIAMMAMVLVVALPTYVCATSSTPLVAALLAKGLDPGAALVFLLAGPATNVATVLALRKELGSRGVAIYVVGLMSITLVVGVATSYLFRSSESFGFSLGGADWAAHESHNVVSGIILTSLLAFSLIKRLFRSVSRSPA